MEATSILFLLLCKLFIKTPSSGSVCYDPFQNPLQCLPWAGLMVPLSAWKNREEPEPRADLPALLGYLRRPPFLGDSASQSSSSVCAKLLRRENQHLYWVTIMSIKEDNWAKMLTNMTLMMYEYERHEFIWASYKPSNVKFLVLFWNKYLPTEIMGKPPRNFKDFLPKNHISVCNYSVIGEYSKFHAKWRLMKHNMHMVCSRGYKQNILT